MIAIAYQSLSVIKLLKNLLLLMVLTSGCATPIQVPHKQDQHWFSTLKDSPLSSTEYFGPAAYYPAYSSKKFAPSTSSIEDKTTPPARPPLSPGDRIRLFLLSDTLFSDLNDENQRLNGIYEVGIDGQIKLPFLPLIPAAGLSLSELERKVSLSFEKQQLYRRGMAQVSLTLVQWAPANVYISGTVFQPGLHIINQRSPEAAGQVQTQLSGNLPLGRMLPTALKAAGGVRPNADISRIELKRGDQVYLIDLSGLVLGYSSSQAPLMDGDQLFIPDAGSPQQALMQPSAITPPGIRVFISNLTVPAASNANSAIARNSTSLPYGTRLLNAVVSGNCAGGSASTNSSRYAVLITQNPSTQQPVTIERKVEGLLQAPERLDVNPFLMPNDSIICYDSHISNARDIGRAIIDILLPFSVFTL